MCPKIKNKKASVNIYLFLFLEKEGVSYVAGSSLDIFVTSSCSRVSR